MRHMITSTLSLLLLSTSLYASPPSIPKAAPGVPTRPQLATTNNPLDAIAYGSPDLSFRPRYEHAEQDNPLRPANAFTMRTLLGLQTQQYRYFDAYAQLSNVSALDNSYNSLRNHHLRYVIIADPTHTDVNQAYLGFSGVPLTYFKIGRQLISLDNQRFVGPVMFRQNTQNFDAASVMNQSIPHLTAFMAYLNRIDTVARVPVQANDFLFNAKYDALHYMTIVPYAYLLEHHGPIITPLESTNTYGLRLTGNVPYQKLIFSYTGEYATQRAAANNPLHFSAFYYHLGAAIALMPLSIGLDEELLSGKNTHPQNLSFRTPLATKHLFLGWADMFLITPTEGIKDRYATISYSIPTTSFLLSNNTKLTTIYHDFKTQRAGHGFGHEWDFDLTKTINKAYSVSITYADFATESFLFYPKTRKLWLTATATFS